MNTHHQNRRFHQSLPQSARQDIGILYYVSFAPFLLKHLFLVDGLQYLLSHILAKFYPPILHYAKIYMVAYRGGMEYHGSYSCTGCQYPFGKYMYKPS